MIGDVMRKFIIFILFILPFTVHSVGLLIPKPFSNKYGGLFGYTYIQLTSTHSNYNPGKYVGITQINIRDKASGISYRIFTDWNGFYYKFNLKPGLYEVVSYDCRVNARDLGALMLEELPVVDTNRKPIQIVIGVHEKTISIIKPIVINIHLTMRNDSYVYYSQATTREDDIESSIKALKELDKNGYYTDYAFENLEVEN
jgi:hypothetical protein